MSSSTFVKQLATRRTIYALSKANFPLKNEEVVKLLEDVIAYTPTSFNNQTNRAVILFGDAHDKLWNETVYNAVKAVSPAEAFENQSAPKLKAFGAGYGTVLWFQDTNVVKDFESKFEIYAPNFSHWSDQSSGAAQMNLWTALANEKVGANLQHYNELIAEQVQKEFKVPSHWQLTAQQVFGSIESGPGEKQTLPSEEVIKVVGA